MESARATASQGAALPPRTADIAIPRYHCAAAMATAAMYLLDMSCAPAWDACPRDTDAPADSARIRRDLPSALVACTVQIALAVALYRRVIASISPTQRWDIAQFDFAYTQAVRHHDLGMPRADPYMARAFVEAVTHDAHPEPISGELPVIRQNHPTAPLPPLARIGLLDLEAAATRAWPQDRSAILPAPLRADNVPEVRTHLPGMPWLGIYGWRLQDRPWPAFPTPLRRQRGSGRWALDMQASLTAELLETRTSGANDMARQQLEQLLIGWRAQYRGHVLASEDQLRVASHGLHAVESAIAALQIPAYWSTVLVAVRHRGRVVAVLHGSLGAFGRSLARIHAVAIPATSLLPPYGDDAVRGAIPYAIGRFANYARAMNSQYLVAMIEDDPATQPPLPAPVGADTDARDGSKRKGDADRDLFVR